MPKLIFIDRHFSGQVYPLVLERTTVGRSDKNTLVIHHDSVSARHCEILLHDPEVIVRDLDSRNGTFVNGAKVHPQSQLKHGQTVRFGSVEARLELDPVQGDGDATESTAVHAHARAMREQRRARQQPKPDPAMTLSTGSPPADDEQTVLLPNPAPDARAQAGLPEARTEAPRTPPFWRKAAVIALVIGLGLLLAAWWLWRRP